MWCCGYSWLTDHSTSLQPSHSNTCRSTICLRKVTKIRRCTANQNNIKGNHMVGVLSPFWPVPLFGRMATVNTVTEVLPLLSNSYPTKSLFYQNKQTITREFQHQTWFFPEKGLWANRSGFFWTTEMNILINLYAICILQGKQVTKALK